MLDGLKEPEEDGEDKEDDVNVLSAAKGSSIGAAVGGDAKAEAEAETAAGAVATVLEASTADRPSNCMGPTARSSSCRW